MESLVRAGHILGDDEDEVCHTAVGFFEGLDILLQDGRDRHEACLGSVATEVGDDAAILQGVIGAVEVKEGVLRAEVLADAVAHGGILDGLWTGRRWAEGADSAWPRH